MPSPDHPGATAAPPPQASPPPDTPRGLRAWCQAWLAPVRQSAMAIGLAVFVLSTLWLGIAYELDEEHATVRAFTQRNLTNLSRAFAEHTAKTLDGADQAVRFTRNEYLDKGAAIDLSSYLGLKGIVGPEYHLVSIIGPDGYVSHSTQPFQRVDLRDREHFRVHTQSARDQLFVSKPVLGRVSQRWSSQLTRRITLADGRFGGVVVLSLSPEYLTRFYADVDLGPRGAIALVGQDGVVRASASQDESPDLRSIEGSPLFRAAMAQREGTLVARSPIDGIERHWAFRRLDPHGLIVFSGMGSTDVMAAYDELRRNALVAGSLATLIVLGFVVALVRHARRQGLLMAQLEASRQEAQAGNRLKTHFLATVSHELRTPLNGILGFAETIRDTSQDAESRQHGGVIHASASQLHGLVNTILDLVKIETGRMALLPAPVVVEELMRGVHARHAPGAQARGLRLWMALQPGTPAVLRTDAARLRQVLDQLIGNALKFTAEGEVSVIARGDAGPQGEPALLIEIGDTGIGIAPERLPRLFNRFEAALASFDHAGQGAGLGLPLAHELTTLLGGQLALASSPGQGTTATVRLPLAPPPAAPSAPHSVPEDALHA